MAEDQEGDETTPSAPVKTVDKTSTHTSKRNTDGLAPSKGPAPTGSRRGGAAVSGSEAGAWSLRFLWPFHCRAAFY